MNVTASVDIGDILDLAATFLDGRKAAEDLTKRLVRTVAADSRERFEAGGPGWAPRQQSDEETAEQVSKAIEETKQRSVEIVRKKLWNDFRRAKRKASPETAQSRYALVREFERRVSGGLTGYSLVEAKDEKKLSRQLASVEGRLKRAAEKVAGKVLGKLAQANKSSSRGLEGEVRNMAKFSAAQNEGGQVGNQAVLPARTFLGDTPELEARLEHTTETWLGGLGGG